jgi:hypothetical protein
MIEVAKSSREGLFLVVRDGKEYWKMLGHERGYWSTVQDLGSVFRKDEAEAIAKAKNSEQVQ